MWRETSPEHRYINEVFAPEDLSLRRIRAALTEDGIDGMNIDPYEGRLLQLLIGLGHIRRAVEIGTLYGYSTLWLARALPADGKLFSLESREEHYRQARALLCETEVWPRLELRHGRAAELLPALGAEGPFDLVFIDANKSGYLTYLDWAEAHVRTGGLIVGDNTLLFGHVAARAGEEPVRDRGIPVGEDLVRNMREFNRRLADPARYRSVLMPTAEGMTVAQKLF